MSRGEYARLGEGRKGLMSRQRESHTFELLQYMFLRNSNIFTILLAIYGMNPNINTKLRDGPTNIEVAFMSL